MYLWDDIGDIGGAMGQLGLKLTGVTLLDIGADRLDPGPVGRGARIFVAPAPKDLGAFALGVGRQLLGGAGLADSRSKC